MKKTLLIVLFVLLCQAGFSQAFKSKATFGGIARSMSRAFAIPSLGKGYVVGGSYNTTFPNEIWEYDTLANSWTKLSNNYPGLGDDQVAFSIGDYGYVGTGVALGYQWDSTFWRFNPGANTWTKLAHFPGTPRGYGAGFAINGKGYIGGGTFGFNIQSRRDFYEYDPAANQWTRIDDCPAKGCGHSPASFSLNGKGYVGTGSAPDSTGQHVETAHDDFWAYDPTTGNWDSIAPFPGGPRVSAIAFATCDRAYVGCGYYLNSSGAQVFCNDFYEYNPAKNQWTRIDDMGTAGLSYLCAFTIGKSGYVGTGSDASGYYGNWWEYHAVYTPAFSAPSKVCSGSTVTFTDTSVFSPTNHAWSFPGGTPGTSTAASVDVAYNTAGSHDVTLTSWNGCDSASKTFYNYITVDSAGTLIISPATPHVCSNQTITLSVDGGGTTYKWSPSTALNKNTGDSVVVNGSGLVDSILYTVTDTSSSGCPAFGQVTVRSGGSTKGGHVTAVRDTICQNTSGNLTLTNNSSNTLQWQLSADDVNFTDALNDTVKNYKTNPLTQSTWYRVIVGSGSCIATSDTLELYVPPTLIAKFSYTQSTSTQLNFDSDSSGGSIHSYHWDFGDSTTSNEKNPSHIYAKDSTYYVCLTLYDGSNCSYTFCRYSIVTGIPTVAAMGNWVVYPDPFTNELIISAKNGGNHIQRVEMYDVLGQLVVNKIPGNATNSSLQLDVSSLAKGMYYVMIRTAGADYVQKVVKQ